MPPPLFDLASEVGGATRAQRFDRRWAHRGIMSPHLGSSGVYAQPRLLPSTFGRVRRAERVLGIWNEAGVPRGIARVSTPRVPTTVTWRDAGIATDRPRATYRVTVMRGPEVRRFAWVLCNFVLELTYDCGDSRL